MNIRPIGVVKWFDAKKGFGFITSPEGTDLFVHYSDIQTSGYASLEQGQAVQYDPEASDRGTKATNVAVV
jgi:CspA family cold shock protein